MADDDGTTTDVRLYGPIESQRLLARVLVHRNWAHAVTAVAVCGAFAALFFGACPVVCG